MRAAAPATLARRLRLTPAHAHRCLPTASLVLLHGTAAVGYAHRSIASMNPEQMEHRQLEAKDDAAARGRARTTSPSRALHRSFVAFGSNMGDRQGTIEAACHALDRDADITLRRTSSIWQTKAMYVEDQGEFLNGVLEVDTTLKPLALLDRLQGIENALGRKRTIDKGPRTLDLDILLYDDEVLQSERLEVPHKLMLERPFVLHPLCQMIPNSSPPDSPSMRYISCLQQLSVGSEDDAPMSTRVQIAPQCEPLTPLQPKRTTRLMSILNVTPDSFSDGGLYDPVDLVSLKSTVEAQVAWGASIIDIGGESTRPNAAPVQPAEELSRVLPAIQLINTLKSTPGSGFEEVAISIDTYHANVAREAVEAGADIVNDVSSGTLDSEMLPTVAQLGCAVILMHMRGNPSTMMSKENTSYDGDLIATVGAELAARVKAAEDAGIRRWRIVLDPGIGFAKNQTQNLEILRRFHELKDLPDLKGFPWVIGASRKGFIGGITGVSDAAERSWGTAAAVTASIQGGADIIRVHDVQEMSKVAKMSDAIWRV